LDSVTEAALEPAAFGSEDADLEAAPAPDAPIGPPVAEYASSGVAGGDGANVREAPSTTAPLVVRLDAGSSLRITGRTEAQGHQWFRVVLDDRRLGFVRDDVVVAGPAASAQVEDYAPSSPAAAGPDGANVRSAPTIGAPLLVRLDAGSDLRITGRTQAAGRTWYRVVLGDGRQGFVRDDVVVSVQSAPPAQSP
jgi:hypothetical protein